ncbi:MAG: hypothetical protein OHK0022_54600 [Roseiflexaceae bacterium]
MARRSILERVLVCGGLLLVVGLAGGINLALLPRSAQAATTVRLTDTSTPADPTAVVTSSPTVVEPSATPSPAATEPALPPSPAATEPAATATPEPTAEATASPTAAATEPSATPTATAPPPTEVHTPTPTPNAGEPPLVLTKRASQPQVPPGAIFSYLVKVESTSLKPLTVRVRDLIDPQLQAVSAGASSGSCELGAVVLCVVTVARDTPVTLQIGVQVRSGVALGSVVVSQATARDEGNNAASSEPVAVMVVELNGAGAVVPTPSGTPLPPPLPPRTPATASPSSPTPVPTSTITSTLTDQSSSAPAAATHTAAATATPVAAQPTAAQPVAAPPRGAGGVLPRRIEPPPQPSASLPATAGVPLAAGLVVALLGLGLTVRAVRRTRAAGALLADQSRLVGELAPLLRAALRRQRAADSALLAMRRQSERIAELLDRRRNF